MHQQRHSLGHFWVATVVHLPHLLCFHTSVSELSPSAFLFFPATLWQRIPRSGQIINRPNTRSPTLALLHSPPSVPDHQPWDFKHGAQPACDWESGPTGGSGGKGSPPLLSLRSYPPGWVGGWHMAAQAGTPLVWHTEGLEPPRLGPPSPWETRCHRAEGAG